MRISRLSPSAQSAQLRRNESNSVATEVRPSSPQEAKDLMAKLWGMMVEEKDEMIDALIGQEGF